MHEQKWQQSTPVFFPPEKGRVEAAVAPKKAGRVFWRGSTYPAELADQCNVTLLPNENIAVIGRVGITALVEAIR